jgi:hypothetical protein
MARTGESNGRSGKSGDRNKRLAAALRDNLRRRKAQARERSARTTPAKQDDRGNEPGKR